MKYRQGFKLSILSFASVVLYLLLAFQYPLKPSLKIPRASWASLVEATWLSLGYHILIYVGLFLIYILALRNLSPNDINGKGDRRKQTLVIIFTWLVCSFVLLFAAPGGESHDIFDYLFRGRMMVEYNANPLIDVPDDFKLATPFSRYTAWRKYVDTYGPVWESASAAIANGVQVLTSQSGWGAETSPVCPKSPESCRLLIVYIWGYRMLAIVLTGLSGWLVYKIVENSQPALPTMALAAWLINPLTLIATALGGHNDAVMLVLVLLSWRLLQREKPSLAILALIFGAHVKLTALIWFPTIVLWIVWQWGWKHSLKICLMGIICGLAISWLLYWPFGGWQTLPRMLVERSKFFANSLWQILNHQLIYRWDWSVRDARILSTNLPNLLSALGLVVVPLWMFNFRPIRWRSEMVDSSGGEIQLWRALTAVSFLYLLIGTYWFQHWYVLWVLAPAVLLPDRHFIRIWVPWLAFGAMTSNVVMSFLLATELKDGPKITVYVIAVAIIWGPLLVAFCVFTRKFLGMKENTNTAPMTGIEI